jgi:hypothetical protein
VTLDEVLGRLQGVRRLGTAKAQALCPAHADQEPSLSVDVGENGCVLMHCHAGCTFDDILAAAELTKKDLFPTETSTVGGDIVYDYVDEKSVLISQVVRKPGKRFVQRRPDGTGGWSYKLKGVRRVLYRLPEILGADPSQVVFVAEGEKDVDNVRRLGLIATTNPGGTGNGRLWDAPSFREPLRGRSVVILPDNDEPGAKHAASVARALHGCAMSVKILALPDLPAKGDVSNWIEAGGTREKLQALAPSAAPWTPSPHAQGEVRAKDDGAREERERPTQARLLVALAQEHAELFKTADDEAYATIRDGETLAVRSKGFRSFLVGKFFATYDRTPSSLGLKEAADTLETLALVGGVTRNTFLRAGAQDDRLFVDLGDPSRRIVEIGPGGTAQSKRALYTDDEEHIIEAIRPVIVNGIDDMTARPDFASRALAVDLPQIREDQRQEESEF